MNSIEKTLFLYVVEYKIFKALQGMHPLQKTCKLMSRFFGSLCAVQQNKKRYFISIQLVLLKYAMVCITNFHNTVDNAVNE